MENTQPSPSWGGEGRAGQDTEFSAFSQQEMTVDLYIRVSTGRQAQDGDSLEEQEAQLRKYCEFRGFKIHQILIEKGRSAGNVHRPKYQQLLRNIRDGKIQAVVIKKIDRLSRSLLDFEELTKIFQANNVGFISLKENFDTTSAMGKAMLRVALVFAQLEREQTSERLIDVLEYRANQGMYNGGPRPFGYTPIDKELTPHPKEKLVVSQIFEQFLDHGSTTQIAKFLNESGFKTRSGKAWDKKRVQKLLQNPVYTGKIKWKGHLHPGLHAPIISESVFESIQDIFKRSSYAKPKNPKSLLQKVLICGHCQAPMTPSHSLNKKKIKYHYYRCTRSEKTSGACPIKQINIQKIEPQIRSLFAAIASPLVFQKLEQKIYQFNQAIGQIIQSIQLEIQTISTQIETLKAKKDQFLDSLIQAQFTEKERHFLNSRIEELDAELKVLKSKRYQAEFQLTDTEHKLLKSSEIKQVFLNLQAASNDENTILQPLIQTHIQQIIYEKTQVQVLSKILPWTLVFHGQELVELKET